MRSIDNIFEGLNEEKKLTEKDEEVLHRIFNPQLPFGFDDESNSVQQENDSDIEVGETEAVAEAKRLEVLGVQAASDGDLEGAVDLFTQAILKAPERPSCYNNRAQALRLLRNITGALVDLNKALELSEGRGRAARQAFTQRGLLRRLQDDVSGAEDDFKHASALGSDFAKTQIIAMNPYAALCGAAVCEMMQQAKGQNCTAVIEGEK